LDKPCPTAARRGLWDRPRPEGHQTMPRGPATPPMWPLWDHGTCHAPGHPDKALRTGHAPRRPDKAQGNCHTPRATRQGLLDRPRPKGGHTWPRNWSRPRATGQSPGKWPRHQGGMTKPKGPATPPGRPDKAQGTGQTGTTGQGRPQGSQTEHSVPDTLPHQPNGTQGTDYAPEWQDGAQGTNHALRAAKQGPAK